MSEVKFKTIKSNELDYAPCEFVKGSYSYTKLAPLGQNGSTVTITPAGGDETKFEIPAKVFNLSKSYLSFRATPTQGTHFNWLFMDGGVSMIQSIALTTYAGTKLVDANYVSNYLSATIRKDSKLEDMQTWGKFANAGGTSGDPFEGLSSINRAAANLDRTVAANAVANNVPSYTNGIEARYIVGPSADNTAGPIIDYRIQLDKFKGTLLALDKDLYFGGQTVTLTINWCPSAKFCWNTTNANDFSTGAAAITCGLTFMTLVLAIDSDPKVLEQIKQKMVDGTYLFEADWLKSQMVTITSDAPVVQVKYNITDGSRWKKSIWAPYGNSEQFGLGFDHSNNVATPGTACDKINVFHTEINGVRTHQYDFNCTFRDDWTVSRRKLRGSCILSANEYYYNFAYIEDLTDNDAMYAKPKQPSEDKMIVCADLSQGEILYSIVAQSPASLTLRHYVFSIFQRTLKIFPDGTRFFA